MGKSTAEYLPVMGNEKSITLAAGFTDKSYFDRRKMQYFQGVADFEYRLVYRGNTNGIE